MRASYYLKSQRLATEEINLVRRNYKDGRRVSSLKF